MSDAGCGHEAQDAFRHAESRAQDGDDAELLARELLRAAGGDRRLDRDVFQRQAARDLIRHEHGNLFQKLPEIFRARFLLPHERELVLHKRMIDDVHGQLRPF